MAAKYFYPTSSTLSFSYVTDPSPCLPDEIYVDEGTGEAFYDERECQCCCCTGECYEDQLDWYEEEEENERLAAQALHREVDAIFVQAQGLF